MCAYASPSDVGSLTRNLLGSASEYDTTTCPTLAQVNAWLSSGCALIDASLKAKGYGAIPTSSEAYDFAREVNALYASWLAERSRTGARVADNERTRADMLKRDFNDGLTMLLAMDFSYLGITPTVKSYAGGIDRSDKTTVELDTDRVQPRFSRGQFRDPEGPDAAATSAS